MATIDSVRPPADASSLAAWFAEGVHAELTALEKDGGSQSYEVLAGKLIEKRGQTQAIFQFILADGTRIPEEAAGKLKTASDEFMVTVIGQQADRIDLRVETKTELPPGIHRATLIIDDTALLRKLAQVLDEIAQNPTRVNPLAVTTFHPAESKIGIATLRPTSALVNFDGQPRRITEQACGSPVTYIWGPPGTGKTYTIAHLVTALIEAGERVLVSSHTHAAVDQALYEAVKSETGKGGPLAAHPFVLNGNVLRIGDTPDKKIPATVRLNAIVEAKARTLTDTISDLTRKEKPLVDQRSQWLAAVAEWERLAGLSKRLQEVQTSLAQQEAKRKQTMKAITGGKRLLQQHREELERAKQAWFFRATKTAKALQDFQNVEKLLQSAEKDFGSIQQEIETGQRLVTELGVALKVQQAVCSKCLTRQVAEQKLSQLALELEPIE
jgi:hypothetical protein